MSKEKLNISSTMWPSFNQDWSIAGPLQTTVTLAQGGSVFVGDRVLDSVNLDIYSILNPGTYTPENETYTDVKFAKIVNSANIASVIASSGWQSNTPRSYTDQSALDFNTSRRPSVTNDVLVITSINFVNTASSTTTITVQISSDDINYDKIAAIADISQVNANVIESVTFIVPVGYYYKLTTAGGGTSTIINLSELVL